MRKRYPCVSHEFATHDVTKFWSSTKKPYDWLGVRQYRGLELMSCPTMTRRFEKPCGSGLNFLTFMNLQSNIEVKMLYLKR